MIVAELQLELENAWKDCSVHKCNDQVFFFINRLRFRKIKLYLTLFVKSKLIGISKAWKLFTLQTKLYFANLIGYQIFEIGWHYKHIFPLFA